MKRTPQEIAELKQAWLADPWWDIEDTLGFEENRDELYAFSVQQDALWAEQRKAHEATYRKNMPARDMTARMHLAGMAMQGLLANPHITKEGRGNDEFPVPSLFTSIAVEMADALIKELTEQ